MSTDNNKKKKKIEKQKKYFVFQKVGTDTNRDRRYLFRTDRRNFLASTRSRP